jgi:predicted RNase H-like HicB family nuclease
VGRCTERAKALNDECLKAGGNPDECAASAREALEACVTKHCTPPTCDERCARFARKLNKRCVDAGNSVEECAERAREANDLCRKIHCEEPPECGERCANRAARRERRCLEFSDESPEQCKQLALRRWRRCVTRRCDGPKPPDECGNRCEVNAQERYHRALRAGYDEMRAARRARRMVERCIGARCGE